MIHSITLENFFSFKDPVTIELSNINILLGINGSGKSNLLKAIRLLHEAVSGNGFESIFQKEWGGFNQVVNSNGGHAAFIKLKYEFNSRVLNLDIADTGLFPKNPVYEINIYPQGTAFYYISERFYIPDPDGDVLHTYLDSTNIGRILIAEIDPRVKEPTEVDSSFFPRTESILPKLSSPQKYLHIHIMKESIGQVAAYDYFNTASTSPIRKPAEYSTEQMLMSDGSNLAQLLNKLKINNTLVYDKIEKLLTKVNPNFKSIEFEQFPNQLYLSLKERNLNRTVGSLHMSDGTLRFLLYITMLYNPNRGKLICIDEPENGLHPDMINTIAEAIKEAAKETQLLIATHSPLLLNQFELDNIVVFEKNADNNSTMERKGEEQFDEWEGEFLPGQMWLRGQLGGKRW